jgi:hypothetical protein
VASVAAFERPGVAGFLHRPDRPSGDALVLTHGAGGNCRAPLLVEAANALCAAGLAVLRCDLPFRQRRPTGPPSPSGSIADRAGLRDAIAALRDIVAGRIFIGGQSYGGRQASLLAAEAPAITAGLLLLSYPLHPPGKPEQMRTKHFPLLRVPALFVQGTRDPFGSIAEIENARSLIPAPTLLLPIDGAGHDLRRGRFDLAEAATAFLHLVK